MKTVAHPVSRTPAPAQVRAAYEVCRQITRSNARNFYYGFLLLPRRKRNAIISVYAFMRHADDISDDPQLAPAEKQAGLCAWLEAMHRALSGEHTDDPVLIALADTHRAFHLPIELLDSLVKGTAMDIVPPEKSPLNQAQQQTPLVLYRGFDELYDYCYHVASVVGLITIRIFGYHDPAAELLAERTGVAFQLTNIIRDVREDALLGRIYLPQEDLDRFGADVAELSNGSPAALQPVLALGAERAREFYRSAQQLVPLIDADARPALWTLVEIYRRLLEKIVARNFDVFRERVHLSTGEKLAVLAKGMWLRLTS